ncbi:MAG: tryptophan 2,3-dioxygenase [Deltaproteobacteria bacterium]|nr:tryptophan 2,3-dioxygenase [Deltaproteobacteria bacterium]
MSAKKINYGSYLRLNELLALQQPLSDPAEHDEMLFIVIHQVYELWFKQLLHELSKVRADLVTGDLYGAIHSFKRTRMIMKTLVGQLDILETMTPLSFNSFRARLEQSSGFQSVQFREVEFLLGYKRAELLRHHPEGSAEYRALQKRLHEMSIVDALYDFLEDNGAEIPPALRERDVTERNEPNVQLQTALVRIYRERPDLAILLELMTDFDEGFQEWRYRHVKVVERTIGFKQGTGGSLGVPFLKESLFNPIFPDLWAIRGRF